MDNGLVIYDLQKHREVICIWFAESLYFANTVYKILKASDCGVLNDYL